MQKGNRYSKLGTVFVLALTAGISLWTTGCGHDDAAEHRSQHAGWHERGSYDSGYDNANYDRNNNYDRNHYDNYNHDYR